MRRTLFLLFLFFLSPTSQAYLTSDFDTSLGYASLDLEAGESFIASLEEVIFEFNYNLNYAGPDVAFNINFSEIVKDGFSNIAYTRFGVGVKWFFFGFNGEQLIIDNKTKGLVLRPTPFIGMVAGLTNLSITDESSIGDFNTSNYEMIFNTGLEVPITPTFLFLAQLQGLLSISSNSETEKNVSYTGFSILAGIKVSRF